MNCNDLIDNMGGIISVKFILHSEIKSFDPIRSNIVELEDNIEWRKMNTKRNDINIVINAVRDDAGLVYSISGSIVLKKNDPNIGLLRNSEYILIKIKGADMTVRILGTDEYPIQITLNPLTPSIPSGFVGYQLNLAGKQLFEPPILIN